MVGKSVEIRMKSGLKFRFALYSAEVRWTFMLTYILFMVVMQCLFPTVCRWVRYLSADGGPTTSTP